MTSYSLKFSSTSTTHHRNKKEAGEADVSENRLQNVASHPTGLAISGVFDVCGGRFHRSMRDVSFFQTVEGEGWPGGQMMVINAGFD